MERLYDPSNYADGDFAPGVVIVGLKENIVEDGDYYIELFPSISIEEVYRYNLEKKTILVITLTDKTTDAVIDAISILKEDPIVTFATPDYQVYLDSYTFTNVDPYYYAGDQWNMDAIDAPDAWETTTGNSQNPVSVGVIDTGLVYYDDHEDLVGNCDLHGYGWDTSCVSSTYEDYIGHGTHVAGIIGANGDNGIGVAGVCWDVDLVPYKVADNNGFMYSSYIAQAIEIARMFNLPIINMSLGGAHDMPDIAEQLEQYSGLIIASAGNDHENLILLIRIIRQAMRRKT